MTAFLSDASSLSQSYGSRDFEGNLGAPRHGKDAALARIKRARLGEAGPEPTRRRMEGGRGSGRGGGQRRKGHGQGQGPREDPAVIEATRAHEKAEDEGLREFRLWALAKAEALEISK